MRLKIGIEREKLGSVHPLQQRYNNLIEKFITQIKLQKLQIPEVTCLEKRKRVTASGPGARQWCQLY